MAKYYQEFSKFLIYTSTLSVRLGVIWLRIPNNFEETFEKWVEFPFYTRRVHNSNECVIIKDTFRYKKTRKGARKGEKNPVYAT